MCKLPLFFLALVVAAFGQDAARMAQIVEAQAAGDRFMGSVLVAKGDQVVFAQSRGWANAEWKIPNSADTKFRLGSVTKQFTAAAIMLLAERGKLQLDDPVSRFITEAPDAWKAVTIRHLLTHTSGIRSFTDLPDYAKLKLLPETPAQRFGYLRDLPLEFPAGERMKYSNSGYVLLGWIVELASGQSYEAFLRENIFAPLGMNDSGYDSTAAILPQRAAGYVPGAGGLANAPYIDMHVPHGAGALYSTTGDLLRWTQGLFGGKLLQPASLVQMTTPFKGNYAFGLVVGTGHGRKLISHAGGIDGFVSHLSYFPDEQVTVAVLCNVMGPAASTLADQLAAVYFGETVTLAAERKAISVPAAVLAAYPGTYQIAPQFSLVVTLEGDQLMTQATGQSKFPLFGETETRFFLKVVDAQVEFFKDEKGQVTHLILHQGGRKTKGTRQP